MLRHSRSICSPLLRNISLFHGSRPKACSTPFLAIQCLIVTSPSSRSFSNSFVEIKNSTSQSPIDANIEEGKIIDTYSKFSELPSLDNDVELQGLIQTHEKFLSEFTTKPNKDTLKKVLLSTTGVGDFYFSEERLDLCVSFFEDALQNISITMKEVNLDIESNEMAIMLHKIGCVHAKNESPTEALKWLDRAMEMKELVFGKNHPEVARTLNTMGMIHENADDTSKALMLYQKAESMTREGYSDGDVHPQLVTICENIAQMFRFRGDYNGALDQYEKLLHIKKIWRNREMCSEHDVVEQHLNIGDCLFNLNSVELAMKQFESAKQKLNHISDEEYTKSVMAVISYNLGLIESKLGNNVLALEHLKRSLRLKQETVGNDHSEVAETLNSIGAVYAVLLDKDLALSNFTEALRIFKLCSTEGALDGKVLQVMSNIRQLEAKFPKNN